LIWALFFFPFSFDAQHLGIKKSQPPKVETSCSCTLQFKKGEDQENHSHYGDGIVVENGRHIFRREFVGGVADEKTCLADGTVADDNAPESELKC
jgi:hypothetical protein